MKRPLNLLLIGILILGSVMLSGCTDKNDAPAGDIKKDTGQVPSDELRAAVRGHGGEPKSGFDPISGWGSYSEPLLQSTLFKKDSKAALINDLATEHTVSPDAKVWTVKIRDDVKFHDGVPLTAKDVAFTFNRASKDGKLDLSALDTAKAIDTHTVEFRLKEGQNTFINKLAVLGIVPEHAYTDSYGQKPIGSGPFVFKQWDKGQQAILEANPDYYGQKPYFKKLTLVFMQGDTAFAAVKAGEVDLAEVPNTYAGQALSGKKFVSVRSIDARGISLPVPPVTGEKTVDGYIIGNDVTSDIAIRKALNYGIDRQALVAGALKGQGEVEFTGLDKVPWGNKDALFKDADVEEAKRILREAGWIDTDGDGIVEKKGVKAEFTLLYFASESERQALAIAVAEQAKKFGISIKPEGANSDKIKTLAASTPVVFGAGTLDTSDIHRRYHSTSYNPSSYNNVVKYNNPVVDNYIKTAMTSSDPAVALKNWQLAAWDGKTGFSTKGDATWVWLATINFLYIMDDDLDIGTPKIQPHGTDIFGNILEWKRTGN